MQMQMIQNTSIIIAESTFPVLYLVRCKKSPQISCQIALEQTSRPYFFCYNVYSTEIGMQKKNITYVEINNKNVFNYE